MTSGYGYTRRAWRDARALALAKGRYRCSRCGRGGNLAVHHLDGKGPLGPRGCDPTNLRVPCRSCHVREHATALTDARSDRRRWPPTPD